jgi:hypothetical protein
MAITINDQPYNWAVRGQKLMIIATSTETAQTGFRYGVEVVIDAKTYNFYLPAAPDSKLYFDLSPLLEDMRNYEPLNFHFSTDDTVDDLSKKTIDFTLTEWWLVSGILTLNEGSEEVGTQMIAINGYFQVIDGYKPNVETGSQKVKYSLTSNTSLAMSDRQTDTHSWYLAQTWSFGGPTGNTFIWIPAYESDYGVLSIPGNDDFLSNNTPVTLRITIFSSTGAPSQQNITLNNYDIEALPVYPANLNDWTGLTVKPSLFANWRCYQVQIFSGITQKSISYIFYNTAKYGQSDCHNDKIRLGWVNSRGGWDYFNFTKRSEITDEIERKNYRKVLFNGTTSIFSANDRGLVERRNMAQQVLTVTSDYISEGEFKFLRSLLVSNQVTWLTTDAGKAVEVPVKLDDTTYVEKKTRDGKLYNVTLKVRIANEYWT